VFEELLRLYDERGHCVVRGETFASFKDPVLLGHITLVTSALAGVSMDNHNA
jgi:hypothetical protein